MPFTDISFAFWKDEMEADIDQMITDVNTEMDAQTGNITHYKKVILKKFGIMPVPTGAETNFDTLTDDQKVEMWEWWVANRKTNYADETAYINAYNSEINRIKAS